MKFAAAIFPLLCASSTYAVDEERTTSTAARRLAATYTPGDFSEGLKIEEYVLVSILPMPLLVVVIVFLSHAN